MANEVLERITKKESRVGIVGLGYVGLPLAVTAAKKGFPVTGFDIDASKMVHLENRDSYIGSVSDEDLGKIIDAGRFDFTTDFGRIADCAVVVICVPTPLSPQREPNLDYVRDTARDIAKAMTKGTLVVLESTTYPGTTEEVLLPILETSGLVAGEDFFVGFSPEREDPGNTRYHTASIPKVVAGLGPKAQELTAAFYRAVVDEVVEVSSPRTAEAVKITENVFRAVNIALVNELKVIFDAMDIDVWEVIDAAATKPFGFMPFYPGPGLGGHCIPIDPFYLTWKAREYEVPTRFIELAGEINTRMPTHVVGRLRETLDRTSGRGLSGARILLVGISYKKNVPDMRESPSMRIMRLLTEAGAEVLYHDPLVDEIPPTREYPEFKGRRSVDIPAEGSGAVDAVLIATDHDAVDYAALGTLGVPVVDTRNAMQRRGLMSDLVIKA